MVLIFDESYLEHQQNYMHPERPERLEAIVEKMRAESLWNNVVKPEPATVEDVMLNHSERYIRRIRDSPEGYIDPDTYLRKKTYSIAMKAVGGAIKAAEMAYEKKETSLALLRPPGHHAVESSSMGFCYFNNIAIAAMTMADKAQRIAIIDPDVHHGNGTQDSFYANEDILYISTHQRYIFPGTGSISEVGSGKGKGFTVNIPFDNGCGDASYEMAMEKVIHPVIKQFNPDMIMVSLGTDAHYEDLLAGLNLSSKGYVDLLNGIHGLAREICHGRFAVFLEGGYALSPLSEIVTGFYGSTQGRDISLKHTDISDKKGLGMATIRSVLDTQKKYWDL
ncbi:MAG: histone deacetylase [Candidatus Thermoplasmatota archaeon]|nr:histone deacetylase [Candidatus Thermoplasmatota archaeon]MDP7264822.1 histone deacetylase [Candidatus Thermoplasmatota archaeon]